MNIWHDINEDKIKEEKFIAVIEIPEKSKCKYELDKETGMLLLDRILHASAQYPANYGFIPRTYSEDNDPLDVLLVCSEVVAPLTLVECYPIGIIEMIDGGEKDEKIIAIPFGDPMYNTYKDISEFPKHKFDEMKHFFEIYKNLENKEVVVEDILGADRAKECIRECIERYNQKFSK